MKISTILDHIDSGHMALPEFQRGYVWNRDQVRGLFDSLYRRHPVGGLLVWATESKTAAHRGDGALAAGVVKLLLDGQQCMTSLYGVVRGRAPKFFDGNTQAFTGLRFHLETETFEFYQPVKMKGDPLWTDVTELMQKGTGGLGEFVTRLTEQPALAPKVGDYVGRLSRLLGIVDVDLYVEEVTGADKSLDVVVNIFNRVNSGGTKLSKGDLALAKICAEWPEGRDAMKVRLKEWNNAGYYFTLDWLLRSVNTVLTGEAKFQHLHEKSATEVQDALARTTKHIDTSLNLIGGRLGLDHDQVFFGRFGVPVMARYLDQRQAKQRGAMSAKERDKLLFWFVQAASGGASPAPPSHSSTRTSPRSKATTAALTSCWSSCGSGTGACAPSRATSPGGASARGSIRCCTCLTRMGEAKDWGTGLALKATLLGKMSRLEVHHIFPKAQLYNCNYRRPEVNALANFCFQTKDTNLEISDRLPEEYFPKFEARHPGGLASQWIPMDPALWKMKRFRDFLEARKELLAAELNLRMEDLLHGDTRWLASAAAVAPVPAGVPGGITSEEEEAQLESLNEWMEAARFPRGVVAYDFSDPQSGEQKAVFDLVWPNGILEELSQPVAVLLNEERQTLALASQAGFRCFTGIDGFKRYVTVEILGEGAAA